MAAHHPRRARPPRQPELHERVIIVLAVTVLAAAVPLAWGYEGSSAVWWALCGSVAGLFLVVRSRRSGGRYCADLAAALLLVQTSSLYLLASARLGAKASFFLFILVVVLMATATLFSRDIVRLGMLGALLLAASWGWWSAGISARNLAVLLAALLSVVVLVFLLESQHERIIAEYFRSWDSHERSIALLTAVSRLPRDPSVVLTGITKALAAVGFHEVVIVHDVDGRLVELHNSCPADSTGQPGSDPLRRLQEVALSTGHQVSGMISITTMAHDVDTSAYRVLAVPIPGSDKPQGVLCGLAPSDSEPHLAAERWARTFADYVGALWRREETFELQQAQLLASARLQQTRSAFLEAVSDQLAPTTSAVRARTQEVLEASEASAPPAALSQLQDEARDLLRTVEVILLVADITREHEVDGRSGNGDTIGELVERLAQLSIEVDIDPDLLGVRVRVNAALLSRALALWLCPDGSRDAGRLEVQRVGQQALLRQQSSEPDAVRGAGPESHGPLLEQLLRLAGAAHLSRDGIHVEFGSSMHSDHA